MPAVYYDENFNKIENDYDENTNKIELEFDSSAEEKDKYNRYLAWIWIEDVLLQNLLVENGLAETYMLQNNYKYAGMLQESEELAKESKLGIWSEDTNSTQDDKNQTIQGNDTEVNAQTDDNNLLYIIIGAIILIAISIFNIAHNNKKEK